MSKAKWNFIIDVIMFVLMGFLAGLGLLIKYILLSGENRWIKYGRNVDLSFWGLDRHEWGTIHLWIAVALIVLLFLHIILHWKMIICIYKKLISNKTGRIICGSVLSVITLLLVVFPFIIKIDMAEIDTGRERFGSQHQSTRKNVEQVISNKDDTDKKLNKKDATRIETQQTDSEGYQEHHNIDDSIEVKGYNTLNEISELYHVPVSTIKSELNIPASTPGSSKLGHLRKQYGFKMSEIELIIYNYLNSENHEKDN